MPGSLSRRNPEDSARINIFEQGEIDYWTEEFRVSEKALKRAVVIVGSAIKDLRLYFGIQF